MDKESSAPNKTDGAEMYRETLRKALADNKPYHIVSRRYEVFDH